MADVKSKEALIAYSHITTTIDGTARAFTQGHIQPDDADSKTWAQRAYITIDGGGIRFTYDGTTPTTTIGHNFTQGDAPREILLHRNIDRFQAIANGGTAVQLHVTLEREN